jgi:hypothetical protein
VTSVLSPWHDFFVLMGTAAATLLGLVFVAGSIAATLPKEKLGTAENRTLWVGPIITAFVRVLVICALGTVPGHTNLTFGGLLAALATLDAVRLIGLVRGLRAHQARAQDLDSGDWRWYAAYPIGSTVLILAAGVIFALGYPVALFGLAAGVIGHLVIGIHNAWELVDWLATLT